MIVRSAFSTLSLKSSASMHDWTIQIPLSELAALQALPGRMDELTAENKQLRREVEALRLIQSQTLEKLGDIIRDLRKG